MSLTRSILDCRPDFARMDLDDSTPLHYAVLARNAELTHLLVQHGAGVEKNGCKIRAMRMQHLTRAEVEGFYAV